MLGLGLVEGVLQTTWPPTCYASEVGFAVVCRVAGGRKVKCVVSARIYILATLENHGMLLYSLSGAAFQRLFFYMF